MHRAFLINPPPRLKRYWVLETALCLAIVLILLVVINAAGTQTPPPPQPAYYPAAIEPLSQSQPMPIPKPYILKELAARGFRFLDAPPAVRPPAHIAPAGSLVKTTPVNFVILCDPLVKQGENHYLQTCTMKAGE